MPDPQQQHLVGLDYLDAVTTLLQRIRLAHPTSGLWEVADRQWSWRNERATDVVPQLFWFDEHGQPLAAAITTSSPHGDAFDPIVMPDAAPEWRAHVVEHGLAHAASCGLTAVELEVDRQDRVLQEIMASHSFTSQGDGAVEAWIASSATPPATDAPDGYTVTNRQASAHRPHHMISVERNHSDPEERLKQTSLYRPDLDLVVFGSNDDVAAYGLFWYDAVTATGMVEPMRTEDRHQGQGLARCVLTMGLDLLVTAGAERIKIVYEDANEAARHLYLNVGFQPHRYTDIYAGPTAAV